MDISFIATWFAIAASCVAGLEFGLRWLKKKGRLGRIIRRIRAPGWGTHAVYSAARSCSPYLDRVFGKDPLSARSVATCVAVAVVITVGIVNKLVLPSGLRINVSLFILAVLNGLFDAMALAFSRMTIGKFLLPRRRAPGWKSVASAIVLLCVISYFTLGATFCAWWTFVQLFMVHGPVDVPYLLLIFFTWLPSLMLVGERNAFLGVLPGSLTTLVLLLLLVVPAIFMKVSRLNKPLSVKIIRWTASIPQWRLALIAGILTFLATFVHVAFKVP